MHQNMFQAMRSLKVVDGCRSSYLYVLDSNSNKMTGGGASGGSVGEKFFQHLNDIRTLSTRRRSSFHGNNNGNCGIDNQSILAEAMTIYGLPKSDLIEPQIEPCLKFVNFVDTLAQNYVEIQSCDKLEKSSLYLQQCTIVKGLPDPKLFRRGLRCARQHSVDVHSKVVLSSWLRWERREDDLIGISAMDCCGQNMECPKACLVSGYNPESVEDPCVCRRISGEDRPVDIYTRNKECSTSFSEHVDEDYYDMSFCIGDEEIRCRRFDFASLSQPFNAMLYGNFIESRREKINFTHNGISAKAVKAAEEYSRTKRVDLFEPDLVLELLMLANRFCCEEMKSACDAHLASLVIDMDMAMLLVEYGLEETSYLLVAACLQVFLRELPYSMHNPNVVRFFCSIEARNRLALVGQASFLLYYFLSQFSIEDDMKSNTTVMLLERLGECTSQAWEKQVAFHQLGCVMLERKEYKDAQKWFEAAVDAGHTYSLVGVARAKYKRGHTYKAYKMMNSLISDYTPAGWMYQERSLYCNGKEKMMDLMTATELDPTLSYPYKFRAVSMLEEQGTEVAVAEINRILGFRVSPDCLEIRAWFLISMNDYEGALQDVRAIVTLDPHYMMFHGKVHADQLTDLLRDKDQQLNKADCWLQLHDRWSAVDDIGSLAIAHHMLANDDRKSFWLFRESLLLLRLNCHKAAMRCLRKARNHASTEHERLVYEGWILYDTGHHKEAIAKAEESISVHRSFEAFFLKAYIVSEGNPDPESSLYVIELLEEALRCPSDGLRKGQALSNQADIYVEIGKLETAVDKYLTAILIKHTRAHQGLARVYHLTNQQASAYDEMTKLIEKARFSASAYEKRSYYCDGENAKEDLSMVTQLDPLRIYPYRYRAAAFMDEHKEAEAIAELTKAIAFKPDLQLLHQRAAYHYHMGNIASTVRDCEAVLCLDPNHTDTLDLYKNAQARLKEQQPTE